MGISLFVNLITKDSAVGSEYTAGSAPLIEILSFTCNSEMDKSGIFSFSCMATVANVAAIKRLRKFRAYAFMDDAYVEIGSGIIDSVETVVGDHGVTIIASGNDMLRELSFLSVGTLALTDTLFGITHSAALTAISAYAPSGWTFTPAASPINDFAYHQYRYETVLNALIYLTDANQTHFRVSGFRSIEFLTAASDTGVLATDRTDGRSGTCGITSLRKREMSSDFITRVYAFGAGVGGDQFTLADTTRTPATGYSLNATDSYIRHTDYETSIDRIEKVLRFPDISPKIGNRSVNAITAANALYDAAFYELKKSIDLYENPIYEIQLVGCNQLLKPLDKIYVQYINASSGISINADMWVTKATISVDSQGVQTTQITCAESPVSERSNSDALVEKFQSLASIQSVPQPTDIGYTVDFSGTTSKPGTDYGITLAIPSDAAGAYNITVYFSFSAGEAWAISNITLYRQWNTDALAIGYALNSVYITDLGNDWYSITATAGSAELYAGRTITLTMAHNLGCPDGSATFDGFVRVSLSRK